MGRTEDFNLLMRKKNKKEEKNTLANTELTWGSLQTMFPPADVGCQAQGPWEKEKKAITLFAKG